MTMKGALFYLICTRFKNQIKSIVKSPAKLIYALLFIALIVFTAVSGSRTDGEVVNGDMRELVAIVFGFFTVMFLMVLNLSLIHI